MNDQKQPEARPVGPRRTRPSLLAALLAFVVALLLFAALYGASPLIYDTDSYYHLAVARQIADEGLPDNFDGVRMSLLTQGFGDKEVLFHGLLAGLVACFDASPLGSALAGRIGLALFGALLFAVLAGLAHRAAEGLPGARLAWLFPFALMLSAADFTWRLVRLRPELLALTLLLLALTAAARGRYRWLGVACFLFTLAYTAFHALFGLLLLLFLFWGFARRRWEWGIILYAGLGFGLGLVLHPHFPANLQIWAVQNIQFFLDKGVLDVGTEIQPHSTSTALQLNAPFWIAATALLLASLRPVSKGDSAGEPFTEDRRYADVFALASLAFGLLYLLMSRFGLYAFPLASLWLLFEMRARGRWPGRWIALPGQRRLPLAAALALAALVAWPLMGGELRTYRQRTDLGPDQIRLKDRHALAAALPEGAQVAAPWRETALYLFLAPRAQYLNVLDPVFMATPYPEAYRHLESIFDGGEPDVPAALALHLGSDHLAFSLLTANSVLADRLAADPRILPVHRGFHAAFRILPDANGTMIRDWKRAPAEVALPAVGVSTASWPAYAASKLPGAQRIEGYVDAARGGLHGGCAGFVRDVEIGKPTRLVVELAPYGPTSVWLDANLVASTHAALRAVVGQGMILPLELATGPHRLSVMTCEATPESGRAGFYWIERQRQLTP